MKTGSFLAVAVFGLLAFYVPTVAQSGDKAAPTQRWSVVDTAQGAVRIDSITGRSYLLDTRMRYEPKWVEIAEPGAAAAPRAEPSPLPGKDSQPAVDFDAWAKFLKVVLDKEGKPLGVMVDDSAVLAKGSAIKPGWTLTSLDGNALGSVSDIRRIAHKLLREKKETVALAYRDAKGVAGEVQVEPSLRSVFGELPTSTEDGK